MCVLFLGMGQAAATTVRYADLEERVRRSDWVVHARVMQKDHPAPFTTRYALELLEVIKGQGSSSTLTFTVPGGPMGALEMRIPGMPRLGVHDETVLLLERTPAGALIFTNLGLGVFRVDDGQRAVTQTLFGGHVIGGPDPLVLPAKHSLDQLLTELRRLAR